MLVIGLLAVYLALVITNPIIVILHELGHALAYLLLTKPDHIDVFIGSFGDTNCKIKFRISKIDFYVKVSFPFIHNGGMCRCSKQEVNYIKRIIILLAGPFFTLFSACIIGLLIFNTEVHGVVKLYCFSLIICSFISLYANLKPRMIPGGLIGNDGLQILFAVKSRKYYKDYILAFDDFNKAQYEPCAQRLLKVAICMPSDIGILRMLIISLLQLHKFDDAEHYLTELKKYTDFTTEDYLNIGYLQSMTERHQLATENYRKALANDADNSVGLNNLGYELILQGEYQEGDQLLQKAIKISPGFAYPYSNLGYSKIMTGNLDEGKQLVEKSIELDPMNAYAYKYLGVYYLKVSEKQLALLNLEKALELNNSLKIMGELEEARLM